MNQKRRICQGHGSQQKRTPFISKPRASVFGVYFVVVGHRDRKEPQCLLVNRIPDVISFISDFTFTVTTKIL